MSSRKRIYMPYSYTARARLLSFTTILMVMMVTLFGAYAWFSNLLRSDTMEEEYAAALSILQLREKTDLDTQQILEMVSTPELRLQHVQLSELKLNDSEYAQLQNGTILAYFGSSGSVPVTLVMLQDGIVEISSQRRGVLFFTYFQRTALITLLCAGMLGIVGFFSTARIVRPITQLTAATRRISEGDFSMRLPEADQDELSELMHSFNRMTDSLERTSAQQKDFIASVSHEFKTPIASIKGYARLLQMPGLQESDRQEYIRMIAHESDRLARLSDTLLRLSALEKQAVPSDVQSFRLDEQLRQVILRMAPVWDARGITIEPELEEVTITTDGELLAQVWTNLLQNAIKFSEDGQTIQVALTTSAHGKQAEVTITDHGIGMTQETIDHIFERFYQGDKSRSHEGVGLGLNLVQRILTILKGRITVSSQPGQGSSFTVLLPLDAPAPETPNA